MMDVTYTCFRCGIVNRIVPVVERLPDEDIREWMRVIEKQIYNDHRATSPSCTATCISELKIPTSGNYIGGPTVN